MRSWCSVIRRAYGRCLVGEQVNWSGGPARAYVWQVRVRMLHKLHISYIMNVTDHRRWDKECDTIKVLRLRLPEMPRHSAKTPRLPQTYSVRELCPGASSSVRCAPGRRGIEAEVGGTRRPGFQATVHKCAAEAAGTAAAQTAIWEPRAVDRW